MSLYAQYTTHHQDGDDHKLGIKGEKVQFTKCRAITIAIVQYLKVVIDGVLEWHLAVHNTSDQTECGMYSHSLRVSAK